MACPYFFKQLACKPVSVRFWSLLKILKPVSIIYLGIISLQCSYDLPPGKDEQPWSRYTWSFNPSDVRLLLLPAEPVSSYLTFSPLTVRQLADRRLFSVTLLYPRGYLPVRKHGALCCPDFPFRQLTERWNSLLHCKGNKLLLIWVNSI